jgi:hypothetical protein
MIYRVFRKLGYQKRQGRKANLKERNVDLKRSVGEVGFVIAGVFIHVWCRWPPAVSISGATRGWIDT